MTAAKLLFAGTPEFALESLRALLAGGFSPLAVLTQPDRPAGRGKKLTASPVKQFAVSQGIPVWQPETLRDERIVAQIRAAQPDLIVVAAYGLLLPPAVLSIPRRGCLNVHASLLPRWRGAAPIQAAIAHGDTHTGISLMQMEQGLDTGPVLATASIPIAADETAASLHDRLARLGGELLLEKIAAILDGETEAIPQDEALASFAGKIRKQDAVIDWRLPAEQILRNIRAYDPVPGASFELNGEIVRCWRAELATGHEGLAGTILAAGRDGVVVACATQAIRLLEIQRPGRRRITAGEFAGQGQLKGSCLVRADET
jgi:methionyl-tRNA formyltransferase